MQFDCNLVQFDVGGEGTEAPEVPRFAVIFYLPVQLSHLGRLAAWQTCRVSVHNLQRHSCVGLSLLASTGRCSVVASFLAFDVFRYHLGVSSLICSSV